MRDNQGRRLRDVDNATWGKRYTPGKIFIANVDVTLATKAHRLVINSRGEADQFYISKFIKKNY